MKPPRPGMREKCNLGFRGSKFRVAGCELQGYSSINIESIATYPVLNSKPFGNCIMSTDIFISQPTLRLPGIGFQSDKTGPFKLNQSFKTIIPRDSVKDGHDNFLNTLKQVTLGRISKKRLTYAPDESTPVTGTPFDPREMDDARPDQIAPVLKIMAVIEILEDLGFHDATAKQTEVGNYDSGLWYSSGQQSENTVRFSPSPKGIASGQTILHPQTMVQDIRKAAIHLRNGQYAAIINLRSDLFGHIRMQVIFENQLVTIRILVEHAFVKDMIESNLHQLRSDLQQHGLEVYKLEVTVSSKPEDSGRSMKKIVQWRAGPGDVDHRKNDDWTDKQKIDFRQSLRKANNAATVDYFA